MTTVPQPRGLRRDRLSRVDEADIPPTAKLAYRVLHRTWRYLERTGTLPEQHPRIVVSPADLARALGRKHHHVGCRALTDLAAAGLVEILDRDRRRGVYTLVVYGPFPGHRRPLVDDRQMRLPFRDGAHNLCTDCAPGAQSAMHAHNLCTDCAPDPAPPMGEDLARREPLARVDSTTTTTTELLGVEERREVARYASRLLEAICGSHSRRKVDTTDRLLLVQLAIIARTDVRLSDWFLDAAARTRTAVATRARGDSPIQQPFGYFRRTTTNGLATHLFLTRTKGQAEKLLRSMLEAVADQARDIERATRPPAKPSEPTGSSTAASAGPPIGEDRQAALRMTGDIRAMLGGQKTAAEIAQEENAR